MVRNETLARNGLTIVSVQNLAENLQSNNLLFPVILFQPLITTVKINF